MNQHYGADDAGFDIDGFFAGLDAIFAANHAATQAEPYLLDALHRAEAMHDDAASLTVLNELMGFLRSQGRHDDNIDIVRQSLALSDRMGISGTESWLTTLINAATSLRAAGDYAQSEHLYRQALSASSSILDHDDRRLAALHNNLSMLYSSTQRYAEAREELSLALSILEQASTHPDEDLDIASSHTNLALLLLNIPDHEREALEQARTAMTMYRHGHLEGRAHFAATLAAYAQALLHCGQVQEAIENYERALDVIELHYGRQTEYFRTTEQNLKVARSLLAERAPQGTNAPSPSSVPIMVSESPTTLASPEAPVPKTQATANKDAAPSRQHITGMQLSRAYWERYGKALIHDRYPEYSGRIAAGLVGHGSECYGFDDHLSQDHDFGPGFCLWLTHEDYQRIGESLQSDYRSLPQEFMGFGARTSTPRASDAMRRVGVFDIGEFFTTITGYPQAPAQSQHAAWLMLEEPTLAAATNGSVFADPFGEFSRTRQSFKMMPEDVRLSLISRRLGMIAQAGQYNFPRMIARGDGAAAFLSINEFTRAVSSLVFLINTPMSAGYLPYYKWSFAALRRLSARMASRLPRLCENLEGMLQLASAACFGGHGTAEGDPGSRTAVSRVEAVIEGICADIAAELREQGLSSCRESFLEWHRPYVEEHIVSAESSLHSL